MAFLVKRKPWSINLFLQLLLERQVFLLLLSCLTTVNPSSVYLTKQGSYNHAVSVGTCLSPMSSHSNFVACGLFSIQLDSRRDGKGSLILLRLGKLGVQESGGIGKCSEKGFAAWFRSDLALPWDRHPVRALPGKKLLLELDINQEVPGHPDFCHSVDFSHPVHMSRERVGNWKMFCIHPVNISTETNLTPASCDSSSPLPVSPLSEELCSL